MFRILSATLVALTLSTNLSPAMAKDVKLTFAYQLPHETIFGYAADAFANKLSELSGKTIIVSQFPGGQLGNETQTLEATRAGDIDITLTSAANAATVKPEAAVLALHYVFDSLEDLSKVIVEPKFNDAIGGLFAGTGTRVLSTFPIGMRNIYGLQEVRTLADIKGVKMRVQASPTEDLLWGAYGAQTVHMQFPEVYTSLQTGVVKLAENDISVVQQQKHYEVGPIISMTEHAASVMLLCISDKAWNRLDEQQRGWVQTAADEMGKVTPMHTRKVVQESRDNLQSLGVKFVDVDKQAFVNVAKPIQDKIAVELGPKAVEILSVTRSLQQR